MVQAAAHPDAHIIFGASIDEELDDELRVVVIATGFDTVPESAKGPDGQVVPPIHEGVAPAPNSGAQQQSGGFQSPFRSQQQAQPQQQPQQSQADMEDDAFKAIIDIFNHNN